MAAAASAALDDHAKGGGSLAIFALDFSSGALTSLADLPQFVAIGTIADLEATTRIIESLNEELAERRASAESEDERRPRVLLLIDNYANLVDALLSSGTGQEQSSDRWFTQLNRLIVDGRQFGIHAVVTADRLGSVKNVVQGAIGARLVLRQIEDAEAKLLVS